MLSYFGADRRHLARLDPVKLDVERRQRHIAQRLARITGQPPEKLLDYRRYDNLLDRR